MAETYYDGSGPESGHARTIATWTNYAGAAMSLALLIGVGVWGTKLVLRDVSGVPVVVAAEGPMRIAPEQPGGELADHQGLSVNAVPGTGLAAAPADTLRLAPLVTELSDEDVARSEIVPVETVPRPVVQAPLPSLAELTEETGDAEAALHALADQLAAGTAPLSDLAETEEDAADLPTDTDDVINAVLADVQNAATPAFEVIPASVPGVAVSRRPSVRPATLSRPARAAAAPMPPAPETREIAADTLEGGTRLVQLGAFDSPETARAEWARLDTRFGDYLEDKARVIERASSGGKTFYRLRAHGFDDLSDARRFCAAFVAEKADCIPVVTR